MLKASYTVNQDGQAARLGLGMLHAILLGSHAPLHDRVDGFEVTRIEGE